MESSKSLNIEQGWVRETLFGRWFLSTGTWFRYVLTEAVVDHKNLLAQPLPASPKILDIGCGEGQSFSLLAQHFQPEKITGVDIDSSLLKRAEKAEVLCACELELVHGNARSLTFADSSYDAIFCHQLLHHVAAQEAVLSELYRVLVPGGVLMISESCKAFIDSWTVKYLFRHPMMAQKVADEYVALVRSIGFEVAEEEIKVSAPWWSLRDFGLWEKLGFPARNHESTEVLMIARKPR